ncbi:MAG: hypothetical protein KAU10_00510 [Dehalococcoidia bacterium]|nr:hypothetical protein [Dehalococcoidia bacterium]
MALKHRILDIEIDGKSMRNRIVEPAFILSADPDFKIVLTEEVFDHLLNRIREDNDIVFQFKATAPGFMVETEAKIRSLGYDSEETTYFAVLLLL